MQTVVTNNVFPLDDILSHQKTNKNYDATESGRCGMPSIVFHLTGSINLVPQATHLVPPYTSCTDRCFFSNLHLPLSLPLHFQTPTAL